MGSLLPILLLLAFVSSFSLCSAEISQKELRSKEVNQGNVLQLGIQSVRIDPSRVVQLSWQPRQATRKKDEVVARIEEKISAWTLLPPENGRPLQVLHYSHEEAKQRYDYFGNKSDWEVGEPLMATVVLYLSNVSRGGEISFPASQLKTSGLKSRIWPYSSRNTLLKPIKGNAILFFNVHLNASPDKSSHHERHPVLEGELSCATKFFHVRTFREKKVLSESENSDCTDEDDNCPQWAALGECTRNPTFMVGSPDYYGTCRKSCNVC